MQWLKTNGLRGSKVIEGLQGHEGDLATEVERSKAMWSLMIDYLILDRSLVTQAMCSLRQRGPRGCEVVEALRS